MTREEFQKKFTIIGRSKEIRDLVDIIMQVAPSDISVLIYGESGTGKEVFARAIHGASTRASKPLISVNCGAIPEGIMESELFGHKKGSFTGAVESRKGYFELADNGVLFLDEIAEMPVTTQVKLLRAIEQKEFMPVGAETVTKVDVRFLAATSRDLQHEVDAGNFRHDLYFRLKAVTLQIPPLRKRRTDIEELANHFLAEMGARNRQKPFTLSSEALELMLEYHWPGNIRELRNTIESAGALAKTKVITAEDLRPLIKISDDAPRSRALPVPLGKSGEDFDRELVLRALFEIKKDLIEIKDLIGESAKPKGELVQEAPLAMPQIEKQAILNALKKSNGSRRLAASLLAISERTLYRKIKEYDINEY